MNAKPVAPPTATPPDPDQAEQARPGYGVPTQDPRAGAQDPLPPKEAEREARSALTGGGALAGAAAGAVAGVAVAGPVGIVVGGMAGAVAGAAGGAAAGSGLKPVPAANTNVDTNTGTNTDTELSSHAADDGTGLAGVDAAPKPEWPKPN